ncbi:MAG: DNA mismatch repair endonuclease MutL [Fimbriimonadaceae bacterium]
MIAVPLSRPVRLLDPHTVNQIAAGEVVERPASVVKELVENAIDAGATRIDVRLEDCGRAVIEVADNGVGMHATDAETALLRHATSKITSAADLTHVASLGFRGEALAAIAAVSRLTLATGDTDSGRTVLRVEAGRTLRRDVAPGPRGTTITVEDLFFNTPARLKFMKSDGAELSQSIEAVSRYALAHPEIAFRLTHQGQSVLQTSGLGDWAQALAEVWGYDLARALTPVAVEAAGVHVQGFVSPPHLTKPNRGFQALFVNGRWVRSRTLTAALDQAYRDLTPERRYPVVALSLRLDPERVDVNVSPTKSEVKFQFEGQAFEAIRVAVRSTLLEHGMIPSAADIATANAALHAAGGGMRAPMILREPRLPGVPDHALGPHGLSALAMSPLSVAPEMGTWGTVPPPSATGAASSRFPFADLLDGLRVLGQLMATFIVVETRSGLALIDQHVAHERVIYEHLCGVRGAVPIETQALLSPVTLELDRRSAVTFAEHLEEIRRLGFELEPFGGDAFVVRSIPAALGRKDPLRVLRDIADELAEGLGGGALQPTREQIWITTSCKMAVKSGDVLSVAEMEKLIVDLAGTENPYLCPHGRPITVTLGRDELLRKFKRLS